jgi:hypothetical protein
MNNIKRYRKNSNKIYWVLIILGLLFSELNAQMDNDIDGELCVSTSCLSYGQDSAKNLQNINPILQITLNNLYLIPKFYCLIRYFVPFPIEKEHKTFFVQQGPERKNIIDRHINNKKNNILSIK